ncbi:type II secretion system F family protein [Candidatus Saccharibacteria bacterium]|nr:type II secretion system F family protein [Candidatus Saccharibacteria bacterium]
MITFNYTARDTTRNKIIKSTVQAESERAAAKLLLSQDIVPLEIREERGRGGLLGRITDRVSTKDKVIFTRQLATLINAGLPLAQALRTVVEQTNSKKLKSVVADVITSIEGGSSLADAFARHHDIFNEVYISLIAAGEASGTLDMSLERIANQQEKDAEIMSKVRGAMVYPIIVLTVIVGVIAFMLLTVVPQIERLFDDLNQELPFATAVMVGIADFFISFWWLVLLILAFAVYFLRRYIQTDSGRRAWDTLKLRMPLVGPLLSKLYMARFTRTGETLLAAGVPMLEVLSISARSANNVVVADAISKAAERVRGGKALSKALQSEDAIQPLVPQMISIGEQSGGIDKMMGKAASFYEAELDNAVKALSTAIEPVLMVVLAVVAGGLVAAILLPVYGLINSGTLN